MYCAKIGHNLHKIIDKVRKDCTKIVCSFYIAARLQKQETGTFGQPQDSPRNYNIHSCQGTAQKMTVVTMD